MPLNNLTKNNKPVSDDEYYDTRYNCVKLEEYLKRGGSNYKLNGDDVIIAEGCYDYYCIIHDEIIYFCGSLEDSSHIQLYDDYIIGIFNTDRELILNADIIHEWSTTNPLIGIVDTPVLSFNCLSRLLHNGEVNDQLIVDVSTKLKQKNISIVDWSVDETKFLSKSDITKFARWEEDNSKPYPVLPGFTLIINNMKWHKPGSILCSFNNKQYILSIDDDQYFGCELPENNNETVQDALESLAPFPLSTPHIRQGEWFITPCDPIDIYADDVLFMYNGARGDGHLPIDSPDSNLHEFRGNTVIKRDGVYCKNVEIEHDIHPTANTYRSFKDGWCKVIKNRAVRSYSEDGVD